jgi:quinolinate synthase
MPTSEILQRIERLRRERSAVILAHNYQVGEVQDLADFVGDSLGLSRQAAATDADVIVFCGVHFMAETAAILSPHKTVLLPDSHAGCPMADMLEVEELRRLKALHPAAAVVAYVNSTAAVKAEVDVCCTSANAIEVCRSLDADEILFVPDKWLGTWVARHVDKEFHLASGYCPTHAWITPQDVLATKAQYPEAAVIAHPECSTEVVDLADMVLSTSGMVGAVKARPETAFIVCTEEGMLHRLGKEAPEKTFVTPSSHCVCPNMKLITAEKVLWSLQDLEPRITVDPEIADRARGAIERMVNTLDGSPT